VTGPAIRGAVYGAQQPIVGAEVFVAAAGTGGYGGSASLLLNINVLTNNPGNSGQEANGNYYVTTNSSGGFSITGDYSCTPGQQVYLIAGGGNSGSGTNNAIVLMAILGNCPGTGNFASATPFVVVNEVSTVAAAYAMAGFSASSTAGYENVSSSGTPLAKTGVANAFANAANLETLSTGVALATTPAGNGTVPQSEINTLANILAACVNSNGAVTGPTNPTACYTLFNNALYGGSSGAIPSDTATAATNIAHYPGSNVSALYALQAAGAPFQPSLSAVPNDWTIALNFPGGGVSSPVGIAIDGSGDVWVANDGNNSVTELTSLGASFSNSPYTGGGLDTPQAIAIDGSGDAWITNKVSGSGVNSGNGSVTELSSSGPPTSNSPYTGGGLSTPAGLAIDASGNAWVSDNGGVAVSKFNSGGTAQSGAGGYTGGGLGAPYGIAIDGSGDAWAVNSNSRSISKLSNSGTAVSGASGYSGGGLDAAFAVALDGSGNAWVTDYVGSITEFASSGTPASGSPYTGGGLNEPIGIAIDGSGNVWATNSGDNSISEFSNSGSAITPSAGYLGGSLNTPYGVAIDGSGNVWIANSGGSSVTEFIGAATPVITPIMAGLPATPTLNGTSNLGTRP
jgi:sugar lactone lactonase YvrE